jgi:hypothetical protein
MTFKRPDRPRREREDTFDGFTPKARPTAVASVVREPMPAIPKPQTFRSDKWLRAVASLPCVLCYREGATQAAHMNEGKGMAIKTHDCWTAALCFTCHSTIDQGPNLTRAERRALMDKAVLLTVLDLARTGLVKV